MNYNQQVKILERIRDVMKYVGVPILLILILLSPLGFLLIMGIGGLIYREMEYSNPFWGILLGGVVTIVLLVLWVLLIGYLYEGIIS